MKIKIVLIGLLTILILFISYSYLLNYLDKQPISMIDLKGKNTKYKVVVFNDNHANGFYYIEAISVKDGKKQISYAPVMYSPIALEPFVNKEVTLQGKFVEEDGLTNQCRKGWENWCKNTSAYGENELQLSSIELKNK